jgi:hypothetical protein
MTAGAGMEGPFRANLHDWGLFIYVSFGEIENQMPDRTFPPPWSSEEHSAYFVVRDSRGQALAYVYYEKGSGGRSGRQTAALLTKEAAHRSDSQWPPALPLGLAHAFSQSSRI